jgi:hypothetical protein
MHRQQLLCEHASTLRYTYIASVVYWQKKVATREPQDELLPDLHSLSFLKERTCHCCVPEKAMMVTARQGSS